MATTSFPGLFPLRWEEPWKRGCKWTITLHYFISAPVSKKMYGTPIWITLFTSGTSSSTPMPNAKHNTHAKQVPYHRLTKPLQYLLCCVLQVIFGIEIFAWSYRRPKLLFEIFLLKVAIRTHQKENNLSIRLSYVFLPRLLVQQNNFDREQFTWKYIKHSDTISSFKSKRKWIY